MLISADAPLKSSEAPAAQLPASPSPTFSLALGEAVELRRLETVKAGTFDPNSFFNERARTVDQYLSEILLVDVTVELLEKFREVRLLDVEPSTVNKDFQIIRAALREAVKKGWVEENAAEKIKELAINTDNRRRRYLTPNELQALIGACMSSGNPDLWDLVLVYCHTGIDKSEVLLLSKGWVSFEEGLIKLPRFKTRPPRDIAMNSTVRNILARRVGVPGDYFFRNWKTGKPYKDIRKSLESACDRAGLVRITLKQLRHTFATGLITAAVPIYEVSRLLGHKRIETTEIYAKLTPEKNLAAVCALEKIFNKNGSEG